MEAMSIPVQPRHTLRNCSWVHKAYIQKGAPEKATGFTGNPPRAKWLNNPKVHGRGVEMGKENRKRSNLQNLLEVVNLCYEVS